MHNLSHSHKISFIEKLSPEAGLFIYEGRKAVPFSMERVFVVKAKEPTNRGAHAHKQCSQILIVLDGVCEVTCDDGIEKKTVSLDNPNEGLFVPPTIWAEQSYTAGTVLMVLTDQPYDESDYIRDYSDFLKFRGFP